MENPYSLARDILLSALSADRFTSIDLYGASVHESEFLTAHYHGITVTIDFSAAQIAAIKRVHAFLVEHFNEHYTIDELSERFDLSPTVMKKCFRGVYGDSVYAYMKRYRLQMAERLLKESGLTIGEIAAQIGYLNPNKFTSAFVRNTGCRQQNIEKKSEWIENSPLSHCN